MKRIHWGLPVLAVLLLASACDEEGPEPDRVVNVLLRCTEPARRAEPAVEYQGAQCENKQREFYNPRLEVTVRSGKGGSYIVVVPTTQAVAVGDQWLR